MVAAQQVQDTDSFVAAEALKKALSQAGIMSPKEKPMIVTLDRPTSTRMRDPKELLNAVQPGVKHLTINVVDSDMTLWDREVALLLRDHTMVRDIAERVLGNAVTPAARGGSSAAVRDERKP